MSTKLSRSDLTNLSETVSHHEILLLLSGITNQSYSKLFLQGEIIISLEHLELLRSYVRRRELHEPIAKIIQKKEFYGITFKTTRDTLDPRPETELMIDLFKSQYPDINKELRIMDLGSGTGCIGLTLLTIYKNARCIFVDISEEALDVCKYNARSLNLLLRSDFKISNWFQDIGQQTYDAIVSNPPYVSPRYKLDQETSFDPKIALFANNSGMECHHTILREVAKYLIIPNGKVFLEIGFDQSEKIQKVPTDLKLISIENDLSGIPRICIFTN